MKEKLTCLTCSATHQRYVASIYLWNTTHYVARIIHKANNSQIKQWESQISLTTGTVLFNPCKRQHVQLAANKQIIIHSFFPCCFKGGNVEEIVEVLCRLLNQWYLKVPQGTCDQRTPPPPPPHLLPSGQTTPQQQRCTILLSHKCTVLSPNKHFSEIYLLFQTPVSLPPCTTNIYCMCNKENFPQFRHLHLPNLSLTTAWICAWFSYNNQILVLILLESTVTSLTEMVNLTPHHNHTQCYSVMPVPCAL